MRRAVHSFLSVAVGWLVTFSGFFVASSYASIVSAGENARQTGLSTGYVLLIIAIAFAFSVGGTLAGWLCVGLPLALRLRRRQTKHLWLMIAIHVIATVSTFLVARQIHEVFTTDNRFINVWQEINSFIGWWAASTGLFGGAFFWWLQKYR